jgi:hypothetical protein
MIAELQVVPQSEEEWERWAWHHRGDHAEIIQAIGAQKNIKLNEFQVEPINWQQFDQWLEANQQMHFDMDNVLQLPGSELDQLNPRDQQALQSWIYFHWLEHSTARLALGI